MVKQAMVRLVALKPHRVHSRRVEVGETYEVRPRDAMLYRALRWSRDAEGPGTYARRDMRAAASPGDVPLAGMTKVKLMEIAAAEGVEHSSRDTNAALVAKIEEARRAR